jgi:hypothetical protein
MKERAGSSTGAAHTIEVTGKRNLPRFDPTGLPEWRAMGVGRLLMISAAAFTVAACADDPPSQAGYCQIVSDNKVRLQTPMIADQAGIDAHIALYDDIAAAAPLSVAAEWTTLAASLRMAAAMNPGDPASVQEAADTARRSQVAADRVRAKTEELCGIVM